MTEKKDIKEVKVEKKSDDKPKEHQPETKGKTKKTGKSVKKFKNSNRLHKP